MEEDFMDSDREWARLRRAERLTEEILAGYQIVAVSEGTIFDGEKLDTFAMKKTPVTNAEWRAFVESLGLGRDVFVLLHHNPRTGATRIEATGHSIERPRGSREVDWDRGEVFVAGAYVLLKMAENPSAQFDEPALADRPARIFSGDLQPVVGLSSYFHPMAWCLLHNLLAGEEAPWFLDLPTDAEYHSVATNGGNLAWKYPTAVGNLFDAHGRKLLHIDEYQNGRGTTATVDDQRYIQGSVLGIQLGGNVWRPTRFNKKYIPERLEAKKSSPAFLASLTMGDGVISLADDLEEEKEPFSLSAYGLRGGFWGDGQDHARSSVRLSFNPAGRSNHVGFSPVALRARTGFESLVF